MKNRPLFYLFIVNFVIFLAGTRLVPIFPIYVKQYGASTAGAGVLMSITFGALSLGSVLTNRLAWRYSY
jgi:MFS family permease